MTKENICHYSVYQRSAFNKKVNCNRWLLQVILEKYGKISDYKMKENFGGTYAFNALWCEKMVKVISELLSRYLRGFVTASWQIKRLGKGKHSACYWKERETGELETSQLTSNPWKKSEINKQNICIQMKDNKQMSGSHEGFVKNK